MNSTVNKIRPPVAAESATAEPTKTTKTAKELPKEGDPLYKTELCKNFEQKGKCKFGERCTFAHGKDEQRSKPKRRPRRNQRKPPPEPVVAPEPEPKREIDFNDSAEFPALGKSDSSELTEVPEQEELGTPIMFSASHGSGCGCDLCVSLYTPETSTEEIAYQPEAEQPKLKRCDAICIPVDQAAEWLAANTRRPLNPSAPEFVPAAQFNPYAAEFVPTISTTLNPYAAEFVPQWLGVAW